MTIIEIALFTVCVLLSVMTLGAFLYGAVHSGSKNPYRWIESGWESTKDAILWPFRWLNERCQKVIRQQVAVEILTRNYTLGELTIIARRNPETYRRAGEEAARVEMLGETGHSIGEAIASFFTGLNAIGKGFSDKLEAHGYRINGEALALQADANAVGKHEHDTLTFDEDCPRCKWLEDDIPRSQASVDFDDTRVQFDIRRRRVEALYEAGELVPEEHCTCSHERGERRMHMRSCPAYGTALDVE